MLNIIGYLLIALFLGLNIFVGYKFVQRCKFHLFPIVFTILILLSNLAFILPFNKEFKDIRLFSVYFKEFNFNDLFFLFFLIVISINTLYVIMKKNIHAHKMLPWMFIINGIYFILKLFLYILAEKKVVISSMEIICIPLTLISILWILTIKLYASNNKSCDKELK